MVTIENSNEIISAIDNNFFINPLPFLCFPSFSPQNKNRLKKTRRPDYPCISQTLLALKGYVIRTLCFASPSFGGFAFFVSFIELSVATNVEIFKHQIFCLNNTTSFLIFFLRFLYKKQKPPKKHGGQTILANLQAYGLKKFQHIGLFALRPRLPAGLPFSFHYIFREKHYKIWGRMPISLLIPMDFLF